MKLANYCVYLILFITEPSTVKLKPELKEAERLTFTA